MTFAADDHCDSCHLLQTYRQFLIMLIQICVGGEALRMLPPLIN